MSHCDLCEIRPTLGIEKEEIFSSILEDIESSLKLAE